MRHCIITSLRCYMSEITKTEKHTPKSVKQKQTNPKIIEHKHVRPRVYEYGMLAETCVFHTLSISL